MRDTHDLWHTVTGYHGDLVGELSLLAFSFTQTHNPGVGLIIVSGLLKGLARGHVMVVLDGFRRGLRARWLLETDWEAMLALPLEEVREHLRIDAPPVYEPLRTHALREEGLLAQA